MREYKEELTNKDYGDLMTVEEFNIAVEVGFIMDDDGQGYWVKDNKESNDEVFNTQPLDATHVMWYNK